VVLQRYDTLTAHFVDLNDRSMARAQTEKLLRRWRDGKAVL
jgi:hypothetical protein